MHAIALRCQVRIEPQRRQYTADEESGLLDLFGTRDRWFDTLKPFMWMQCTSMVQGFTGITEVDLPLPCTYDFEVTGRNTCTPCATARSPSSSCSRGTVFTRGTTGFGVEQVPWDCEARYQIPVVRVAGHDRALLPEHRLAAAAARHDRGARRTTGPSAA